MRIWFVLFLPLFVVIFLLNAGCSGQRKYAAANSVTLQKSKELMVSPSISLPTTDILMVIENEIEKDLKAEPGLLHRESFSNETLEMQTKGMRKEYDWARAVHFDVRKPNFVIIHHTAQESADQTIRTFGLPHTKVSAHYLIGRDGKVYQMLNDYLRGWHAGAGKWGTITDMNSVSLGIELDNNGREPFPEQQIQSLLTLLDTLKSNYNIPQANFLGHADIAPSRKNDPSVFFPWKRLAESGFGLWYNDSYLIAPPDSFNPVDALRLIGYDVSNLNAAIRAFKRKFIMNEVDEVLTGYDKKVLYNLYQRYF